MSPRSKSKYHLQCGLLAATVVLLSGCEVVDSKLVAAVREYFPRAEVLRPRKDVVHIETHVGNVTRKFVQETFKALHAQQGRDIAFGFALSGYRWLILGFDDFNVAWDTRNSSRFFVLDAAQWAYWVGSTFGNTLDYEHAERLPEPPDKPLPSSN